MWRRTYLLLVLVRLWFALSPSYLHPDENFQGPEVIAGMLVHLFPAAFRPLGQCPVRSFLPCDTELPQASVELGLTSRSLSLC